MEGFQLHTIGAFWSGMRLLTLRVSITIIILLVFSCRGLERGLIPRIRTRFTTSLLFIHEPVGFIN